MLRISPRLCLFAVLLTACSASAAPTSAMPATAALASRAPKPTMIPSPAASSFVILAYATDGIVAEVIPYDKLTHINYSFLTPKADGTFTPINNDWKLKQIVRAAHEHGVRVNISVGGWGWDTQFE